MAEIHYIRNENGDVHSVDHDHFHNTLHTQVRGRRYLRAGVTEISEDEARKANPQLFGARDRSIVRTAKELQELRTRQEWEREQDALDDEDE